MNCLQKNLLGALCVLLPWLSAAEPAPDWKVIEARYPTTEVVVAGFNVLDFGAKPDGKSDCGSAFQKALDQMEVNGGGTVFAPSGRYVIKGNLNIPRSVTLRGERRDPDGKDKSVAGTVLMAYAGRGNEAGPSFIKVDVSAGVMDLSIWYPEQSADVPVPYPFCLEQTGLDNATFENLTLVNPWQGIRIGPQSNELHYIHKVCGTPLKTGIRYDSTTDIGRLEQVDFSPDYWVQSGLPGSPVAHGPLTKWLYENATGIHMLRSDWEYVDRVTVDGYQTGFKVTEGERGAANAQFRRLIIRNCGTALLVEKTNPYGMVFTRCYFEGKENGVLLGEAFDSVVMFSDCILKSRDAVRSRGAGVVLMEQCRVDEGDITIDRGTLSLVASILKRTSSRIRIGDGVTGAILSDCTFAGGEATVINRAEDGIVRSSGRPISMIKLPNYPDQGEKVFLPEGSGFKVVTPGSQNDDTRRIQDALSEVADSGGGTVFLPGGDFRIRGNIEIPEGVELRGIHDVPHHTMGGGSVMHVYPSNDQATITLNARSGIRGMSFNYPEQNMTEVQQDPFLLQGRGEAIHIINVNAANAYRLLDLMTHRCDNHHVDYLSGAPLKTGIAIGGGSKNGVVRNIQFNPHYARRPPTNPRNPLFDPGKFGNLLWAYQKENLDALVIADCSNQFLYQNFVFGSLYGIHFTSQNGKGPSNCISHGHGTDGSKVGVFFEHGSEQITMINTELVAMSSENKTAIKLDEEFDAVAVLVNSMVWGDPDLLAELDGGTLALQNLTATCHGEGILIGDGRIQATNLNFLSADGGHIKSRSERAVGRFAGLVVRKGLKKQSEGDGVSVDLVVERK